MLVVRVRISRRPRVQALDGVTPGAGDHAGVPDRGCCDRRGRYADRTARRHAGLPEYRIDPAIPVLAHQYRIVSAKTLLPVEAAGGDRCWRDRRRCDHGVDAVVPGDALSIVARGAARSGRGISIWIAGRARVRRRHARYRRVGKGAIAPCPPSIIDRASKWWA